MCHAILKDKHESEIGTSDSEDDKPEKIKIAMELEKAALEDDYFKDRKLFPNVDFYSGIVLQEIGVPRDMYTVMFALARSIGWICHWREMMSESVIKIGRPR